MNPQFEEIGKSFVQMYYARFDNKATRHEVLQFYNPSNALLTFEGDQFMGHEAIHKKLIEDFAIGNIKRAVTKVDCQPMLDGGVLVFVLGQLQSADSEGDKAMGYSQTFVLKTDGCSWFIVHDVFRLALHDFATQ